MTVSLLAPEAVEARDPAMDVEEAMVDPEAMDTGLSLPRARRYESCPLFIEEGGAGLPLGEELGPSR